MTETTAAAPAVVPASRWWTADPVRPRAAAALLAVFGLLAIVELACAAAGSRLGEVLTKPLLMPVLAGCVLATAGLRRPAGLAVSGLLFGGVGDAALLGDGGWFLLGMAAFALGHLC